MKLGFSTWGTPEVPIEDALAYLDGLGYDGVELTVIPGYTTELKFLDRMERRRIKDLYHRHNLDLPAIAAHTTFLESEASSHKANMERLEAAIDLAVDLSSESAPPAINTTPGGRPDEWETVRHLLVDRIGSLVRHAASRGVTLALEPHVGASVNNPGRILWLLEQIDSPYLKINFDISHFDVVGISIEEAVPQLAPHTVHTHVKDQRGQHPDFEFLIPGEGTFDYVRYLRAMQETGYTGYITVEVSVMVQRRPDYDPYAAAELSYRTLSSAFELASVNRG